MRTWFVIVYSISPKDELFVTVETIPASWCVTDATLDPLRWLNSQRGSKIARARIPPLALLLLPCGRWGANPRSNYCVMTRCTHVLSVCSSFLVLPGEEAQASVASLTLYSTDISKGRGSGELWGKASGTEVMCKCSLLQPLSFVFTFFNILKLLDLLVLLAVVCICFLLCTFYLDLLTETRHKVPLMAKGYLSDWNNTSVLQCLRI